MEALQEVRRALELDPFSRVINENYGNGLFFLREYKKAIEQYRKVLDLDPTRDEIYLLIAQTYCVMKKFDEAWQSVEAMEKISKQESEVKLAKAYVLASMSREEEARKLLKEIEGIYEIENLSPFEIGVVYFLLGDKNAGFEWLDRAYQSHDGNVNLLLVYPEFDGVRSDPRYHEMLKKVGLSA